MIPDQQTHIVFFSDLLPQRHPVVVAAMRAALGNQMEIIPGTKDIWCRDFMPIQSAPDRFIQFRYNPDYLTKYPQDRTSNAARLLALTRNCPRSDLVIDGGNIVRWSDAAITTEKVYEENPGVLRPSLDEQLRTLLEVDRLVTIPNEPGDTIGHSDGMVRFVDRNTVLVNDYSKIDPTFGKHVTKPLADAGLRSIPFPYFSTDQPGPDPDIPSAIGVHINFLQIDRLILCPIFGQQGDDQALRLLEEVFPKSRIVPVECRELANEGGVLNCVTWNIIEHHNGSKVGRCP